MRREASEMVQPRFRLLGEILLDSVFLALLLPISVGTDWLSHRFGEGVVEWQYVKWILTAATVLV